MNERQEDQGHVLASLARSSLTGLPNLADELVDRLWGDVYVPGGPVPKDDLWRSCHDNIGGMLATLSGDGPAPSDLLLSARATGSRRAQQHCPLNWVLQAWRTGGQVMWTEIARNAGAGSAAQLAGLVHSASKLWGVTERFSIEMATAYQRLEQELSGGPDRYLLAIVDALLDGRAEEVRTEAEQALRLGPLTRISVIATDATGAAEGATRPSGSLLSALDGAGIRTVWRMRGGCLAGVATYEQGSVADLASVLRRHATARFGISPELADLTEIPTGRRMAVLAMSTLPGQQPGVALVDECLPDALLLSSPELAGRLVTVTLGPILALPAVERDELLDTVSAWIDTLGSTQRAAKALYCHRNTVLNRIRRAETLMGLSLGEAGNWPRVIMAMSMLGRGASPSGPPTPAR